MFNMLSGYSEPKKWNHLSLAPIWLRDKFLSLIGRETANAQSGKPAHIIAKMNSLCDQGIIAALYEASAAGVKIELIVRGICCLKTGIPGISDNISVRSIVGNFLEHSRIFYFLNNGQEELYMGSADWMPRNLDKRVEILFPVLSEELKKQVKHILDIQLADNLKAHVMQPDGKYAKIDKRGKTLLSSQDFFCKEAMEQAKKPHDSVQTRVFIPEEPIREESKHALAHKGFDNLGDTVMIVVVFRDVIRLSFHLGIGVGHGRADAGGTDHGQIIGRVAGRDGLGDGDAKMPAKPEDSIPFADSRRHVFQVFRAGENPVYPAFAPFFRIFLKPDKAFMVRGVDDNHLYGIPGQNSGDILHKAVGNVCPCCVKSPGPHSPIR